MDNQQTENKTDIMKIQILKGVFQIFVSNMASLFYKRMLSDIKRIARCQ